MNSKNVQSFKTEFIGSDSVFIVINLKKTKKQNQLKAKSVLIKMLVNVTDAKDL